MIRMIFFCALTAFLYSCHSYKEDIRDRKFSVNKSLYEKATPITLLKKDSPTLEEASGLAVSKENKGSFWTHNDSGDGPNIYLFDREGVIQAKVVLEGIDAFDWEEMSSQATDSINYLYLGDIGDNEAIRDSIIIYRIVEPALKGTQEIFVKKEDIESMVIQYAEGARDAESFFYDPIEDKLVLITKREKEVMVYDFAFVAGEEPFTISSKGTIPLRNFTSADVLPNGDILGKNYDNIFYWKRKKSSASATVLEETPERIPYLKEPQGEAICADEEGNFYTVSERSNYARQEVFFYQKKN